jgi:carbon storage regulator CsrA
VAYRGCEASEGAAGTLHVEDREGKGMLVLGRKVMERVRIKLGDTVVWVEVADIDQGRVRLAFQAPPEVRIDREEGVREMERQSREGEAR